LRISETNLSTLGSARARPQPDLHLRLQARRAEIVEAVTARVFALADIPDLNPEYTYGLREAITAAIDYGLVVVELDEERVPPPPPALLEQARRAAAARVGLDTVLRRYFAGQAVIADFIVEEASRDGAAADGSLQRLLRAQLAVFDRLAAAISAEYQQEVSRLHRSSGHRTVERISRLLRGEKPDTSQIAYDFSVHHTGVVVRGPDGHCAVDDVAGELDCLLLKVRPEEGLTWAWLGSRKSLPAADVAAAAVAVVPEGTFLTVGEPGEGLNGWRTTHQQATAALPIAICGRRPTVTYSDVALLTAVIGDGLLTTWLRDHYLAPLEVGPDEGRTAKATLRAYLDCEGNASSAAVALGVKRHTVTSRLRAVEAKLGRLLGSSLPEIEMVLRLEEMEASQPSPVHHSPV